MPKLIVNAIDNDVHIQDPFPAEGALVIKVVPGTPSETIVTWGQAQRLRPQLTQLESDGCITYTEVATGEDTRADESDLVGLPQVLFLDTATTPLAAGVAVTGAKVIGGDLLAGQVKATSSMASGAITFEAVLPGSTGNGLSVEIIDGAVEAIAGPVGGKITITLNTGASTYATLKTLVNTDPTASLYVVAGGISMDVAVAEAETSLSGGMGNGMSISVGSEAGTFTAVSNLECTYDVDLSALTAGDVAIVAFRSGAKLTQIPVVLS